MRISDWSSDVCSSDLRPDRARRLYQISRRMGRTAVGAEPRRTRRRDEILQGDLRHGPRDRGRDGAAADRRADLVLVGRGEERKGDGEGKGGFVRVDFGGQRSIRKTKINNKIGQ